MKLAFKYRVVILYAILFSLNGLFTCILASLQGNNWEDLSRTAQFCTVTAILANWTGLLLAFFNKTFAKYTEEWQQVPLRHIPVAEPLPEPAPGSKVDPS